MPKVKTKEELREEFLNGVRGIVQYWLDAPHMDEKGRCEGVAFSILTMLDGGSGAFPCSIDLVARPHPDDKEFNIKEGNDYIEDGTIINEDVLLHEMIFLNPISK